MPTKKEVEDHFTSHDHPNYKHTVSEGKKYFRVQQASAGNIARGSGGSVRLFVDKATGETWNSASAKAPNKKQASYASFRDAVPDPVSPYSISDRRFRDPGRDRENLERAHTEAKARADKWRAEGDHPEGVERATNEAAHYEKKLAELHQGEKAEKAALVAQARSSFLIGAPERDPRVDAHATSGGMSLDQAKAQVEIEDLEKKFDAYKVSAKNLRIQAGKHEEEAKRLKDAAMQSDSPSYANMAKKHAMSARNLRNAAETEESNARAVTQQLLTKKGNLAVAQGAYEKERESTASKPMLGESMPLHPATKPSKYGPQTQSGIPVDVAHHAQQDDPKISDWQDMTRQDHADMAVGLEHKLEELHEQAEGLEKIGLSSHSVRDEIAEHEAAVTAHATAAYGKPTSSQLELPANARVAAPPVPPKELAPQQEDRTAAVGAGLHPRDQKIVDFAHRAPTTAPKDIRKMGAERVAKFAQQHIETGLKGGQFYRTGSGAKVYVK